MDKDNSIIGQSKSAVGGVFRKLIACARMFLDWMSDGLGMILGEGPLDYMFFISGFITVLASFALVAKIVVALALTPLQIVVAILLVSLLLCVASINRR